MYEDKMTDGSIMDIWVPNEVADTVSKTTVAKGVLVTDDWEDAISAITTTGDADCALIEGNNLTKACAKDAPAKNNG